MRVSSEPQLFPPLATSRHSPNSRRTSTPNARIILIREVTELRWERHQSDCKIDISRTRLRTRDRPLLCNQVAGSDLLQLNRAERRMIRDRLVIMLYREKYFCILGGLGAGTH